MHKTRSLMAAAMTSLALAAGAARADTLWSFTYAGAGVAASGNFETAGNGSTPSDVLWMSGTYTDGVTTGPISLIANPNPDSQSTSTDGLYYFDNVFGGSPLVDNNGLLFDAGATQDVNLYTEGNGYTSVTQYDGGYVFTPVTFSATAVSEPAPIALLLAGLGALGIASRRRQRR